jgi:hypothetical protein
VPAAVSDVQSVQGTDHEQQAREDRQHHERGDQQKAEPHVRNTLNSYSAIGEMNFARAPSI